MKKSFSKSVMSRRMWCFLFVVIFLATPTLGFAQQTFTQMAPLPLGGDVTDANTASYRTLTVDEYIGNGFTFLIALAGLIAVVRIVWAGILMMSTDAIYKRSEGKEIIRGAVYGLILAIGAFVLLNTISADLITLKLNPSSVPVNSGGNTTPPAPTQ